MNVDQAILQAQKLDKLLSLVRELPEDKASQIKDVDSNASDWEFWKRLLLIKFKTE